MPSALEMTDVTKAYDGRTVVDHVTFAVEPGEIFGLVGPNGSGKTTTIRMALDIVRPDEGTVRLLGDAPSRDALARVGYLPEERGLYRRSSVIDILAYLGRLKRLDSSTAVARARGWLERVGLSEHGTKKVQALSRGMAQIVQFTGALLHEPEMLILDEPFSGLDPLNVQLMKEIIREQQARGATIVLSTHRMADVEEMCERMLLISDGRILLCGPIGEMKRARGARTVRIIADRQPDSLPGALRAEGRNGAFEYFMEPEAKPEDLLRAFLTAGIAMERYEVVLPSLNDIFIEEVSRARSGE